MIKTIKSMVYATFMSTLLLGFATSYVFFLSADSAIAKGNNANNSNGNNGNRNNSGNRGNSGSSSGSLNAAHANANAEANAASNSRVGLIQAYEAAVVATSAAQTEYEDALSDWAEVSEFESGFDSYADFAAAYNSNSTGLEDELTYWLAYAALSTAGSSLTASREIEEMALQLAANKETDEATIARLWSLLGL